VLCNQFGPGVADRRRGGCTAYRSDGALWTTSNSPPAKKEKALIAQGLNETVVETRRIERLHQRLQKDQADQLLGDLEVALKCGEWTT